MKWQCPKCQSVYDTYSAVVDDVSGLWICPDDLHVLDEYVPEEERNEG